MKRYWVQYKYGVWADPEIGQKFETMDSFVNVGECEEYTSLEDWWHEERTHFDGNVLLQVVKL